MRKEGGDKMVKAEVCNRLLRMTVRRHHQRMISAYARRGRDGYGEA